MKRVIVSLGTISFVWGAILIAINYSGLTGFAVASDSSGIYSVFGLSLIIGGLILVFAGAREERGLVLKVKAFSDRRGKLTEEEKEKYYSITDPERHLSKSGVVRLGQFKSEIDKLRSEEGGDELVEIVEKSYAPSLVNIVESDSENRDVALSFLQVLDPSYKISAEKYVLPADERREIVNTFKTYDGSFNKTQKSLLEKYELVYTKPARGPHGKITSEDSDIVVTVSHTPSDHRSGQNLAHGIAKLVEDSRGNRERRGR